MKSKLVYTLLAGTFLTSSAVAETTEVTADYLNSLTTPNINWDKSDKSDYSSVLIGGNEFFFGYTGDEDKAAIGLGYEGSGWLTGGAFYNSSNMGDLTADFLENYLLSSDSDALGGAIYNDYGNINDITGNFVSNYAEGYYAYGGALYNYMGVIDDINGSFIGNYVNGSNYAYGGAIYNYGISNIDDITGSFIGNYARGSNDAYGGAIFNDYNGLIGVITGDFINNYVEGGDTYGGAIYNRSYMGDINGNFENNYAEGDYAYGGALYNGYGNIDDITGNFSYNSAYGYDGGYGGAIYNNSNTDNITGDFTGNYAEGYNASGGAVYNNGEIPLIAGGFYDNAVHGTYANGGAIYNSNYLGDLKGDFSNNYAQSESESIGGAIFNAGGNINDIIGNFSGNYSLSNNGFAGGGALFNNMGVIDDIEGDFTNNYAQGYDAEGGAIFNYGINIDDVTGNFSNNYAKGDAYAYGGAIYSNSLLGDLNGDFSKNHASADEAFGGAIYNTNYIGDINGNFEGNYAKGEYTLGGAIFNVDYGNIDDINGDFIGNYAKSYGDYAAGGAIYNDGGTIDDIIGSFVGNYAQAEGYAFGGAIYNDGGDLTFATEGEDYKISGNYTKDSRGKINNAIWMQNSVYHGPELPANIEPNSINISLLNNNYYDPLIPSLNFKVTKNGSYTIDDQIDGGYYYGNNSDYEPVERYGYGYNLNISGDACPQCEWNSVRFNDLVNNVNNLTISKSQMALGKDAVVNVVNNYIAISNPYLRLDLDAVNKKVGQLNIGGNIEGTTSVIVNVLQHEDIAEENSIVFATAQNHSLSEEEAQKSFEIYRVVGSPYVWAVSYNDINKTWGLYSTSEENTYTEDCIKPEEPETPDDSEESETPEVFDGFMPTLDRIKEGIQIVDYISDIEALPNSAFAYQEAISGDNSFSFTDTNAYGAENDKAYKIVLKPEEFSTSSDLTFTADNNGSIEVQLPNGETQYFSYEYTSDSDSNYIGNSYSGDIYGGGAIELTDDINYINSDFVENNVIGSDVDLDSIYGGAIENDEYVIGDITGDFIGNFLQGENSYGGAIDNYGEIGNITGDFIGNYASGYWDADGGAIENDGTIGDITGDFIGNYAVVSVDWATGGAIVNFGEISNITGDFISNHVKGDYAYGGAINNDWGYKIGNTTGDFIGNYAEGKYIALGGALYTNGNIEYVYDDGSSDIYEIGTITGSFIDNYVKVTDESGIALGGAIFVEEGELTFKADGITNRFSGNYIENADGSKVNNAIWVNNYNGNSTSALNFEVTNGGGYIFDDEIDGGFYDWNDEAPIKDGYGYNVNIYGDVCPQCIVNSVIFNSKVKNVYNLTLDTTQMVLGKNAHIEIVNDYIAQNNPYLRLNVDAVNGKTGQLEIGGQVIGTTQVIANIVNYKDVRGEESIVFATAENDTTGGEESFKIFRTVGSPYKWYVDYDESAKTWGLAMGENINDYEEDCYPNQEPSPKPLGPIQVEPEIIAMEALPSAGLAQTNGMIYNIMRKVSNSYIYCPGCGFYDPNWDGEPFHNVWVDTTYNGLTIEAPVEIDAKVWGIEAGADIQKDLNNKLGIFVSYRQGNYEMDGKGEKYFSKVGSKLDIDSYLAGLYYRYDNNNWYAFATLYGGMQNAEIQTDDGVSADTDGLEFGGSAEVGYNYALNKTVFVTPTLGVFYSQINYDDASDNYGKTVEYDDLRQVELEAGLKLSKAVYTDNGTASVYVKPSIVQTLVDGDEINITEIGKVDTIEDKTLGRIEIGGNYGFNDNWSAYGWANYTFGSDYEATSLGLGLNYAW